MRKPNLKQAVVGLMRLVKGVVVGDIRLVKGVVVGSMRLVKGVVLGDIRLVKGVVLGVLRCFLRSQGPPEVVREDQQRLRQLLLCHGSARLPGGKLTLALSR